MMRRSSTSRPTAAAAALIRCFAVAFVIANQQVHAQASFANVTLRSDSGDLSVVVYLPHGLKPGEPAYYQSTRFDWSSIIGDITRTSTDWNGDKETHVLYGNGIGECRMIRIGRKVAWDWHPSLG